MNHIEMLAGSTGQEASTLARLATTEEARQ
jgi:hypothetical protein